MKSLAKLLFLLVALFLFSHAQAKEHQLGPTGLFGDVSKTAVKVTKIAQGSPADGKIAPGSEIVGASGSKFQSNVRRELAEAIDRAETEEAGGKLTIMLKGGEQVDLTLQVLGTYSSTAPYNCPKTEAILALAAKHISTRNDRLHAGRLAQLAIDGNPNRPAGASFDPGSALEGPPQLFENRLYCTWDWGYELIAACERYLLFGNNDDLPHIRSLAVSLAKGQDAGGLYGHQLALAERNWRLPGYAQMNQPSLSCYMGMLMAHRCGVNDPELLEAIERTNAYVESFVGKGTFAYGVHGPNSRTFNNNGMSATGALVMSLKGNKEAALFFAKMSAASYDEIESGHATHYFNVMWTPLGVALAGPEVTAEFFKEARWVYTMYRTWDGRFTLDGDNTKMNAHAALLMPFTLGRRNLVITGRDADESNWLTGDDAKAAIAIGRMDYKALSADELIRLFDHPLPQVRRRALWTFREKEGDFMPRLAQLMKTGTKHERVNTVGYFGYGCPTETALTKLEELGMLLRDKNEDPDVRTAAASALSFLGEPAWKYYGDMLAFVVEEQPGDTFKEIDKEVGTSINRLCPNPFEAGLVTDRAKFYQAAETLIHNKRQHARTEGLKMLAGMPIADFHLVAADIMHVIEDKDATYHSYHNPAGPVGAAIAVLANLNIREGIQFALAIQDNPTGKHSFKMLATWAALSQYGANAKPALEELRVRYDGRTDFGRHTRKWNAMVKAIEEDVSPPQLISMRQAVAAGRDAE